MVLQLMISVKQPLYPATRPLWVSSRTFKWVVSSTAAIFNTTLQHYNTTNNLSATSLAASTTSTANCSCIKSCTDSFWILLGCGKCNFNHLCHVTDKKTYKRLICSKGRYAHLEKYGQKCLSTSQDYGKYQVCISTSPDLWDFNGKISFNLAKKYIYYILFLLRGFHGFSHKTHKSGEVDRQICSSPKSGEIDRHFCQSYSRWAYLPLLWIGLCLQPNSYSNG